MARTVQHAITVKNAIKRELGEDKGVVQVRTTLTSSGFEVRVVARRGHERRLRMKLARESIGVPIVIEVEPG